MIEYLGDPGAVLVLDETGHLKKGTGTVGVQRQYTGTAGRIENAQVAVYLVYAATRSYAFIDRELYLPKSWTTDADRCAAAAVPAEVSFATKPALAKVMIERAVAAGTPAAWVTGDEVYGADVRLRAAIAATGLGYVLAVAKDHRITTGIGVRRAIDLAVRPDLAWHRTSAGTGAKGHRFYDWALITTTDPGATTKGAHYLLIRRSIRTGEYAFYRASSRRPTSLKTLVSDRWVTFDFAEIEQRVGSLPASARERTVWSANGGHAHASSWLSAGYVVEQVWLDRARVRFRRVVAPQLAVGPGRVCDGALAAPREVVSRRAAPPAALSSSGASVDLRVTLEWLTAGEANLDAGGRLRFPATPTAAGLYRIHLTRSTGDERRVVYIGQTDNLRRRLQHFRAPGPTRQTNLRVESVLRAHLQAAGGAGLAVATRIELWCAGEPQEVDLDWTPTRIMAENAALLHERLRGDVELLNL